MRLGTIAREYVVRVMGAAVLTVMVCSAIVSAVSGVVMVYSLGALISELQRDQIAATTVRRNLYDVLVAQREGIERAAEETRRLNAMICRQLTQVDRVHMACP